MFYVRFKLFQNFLQFVEPMSESGKSKEVSPKPLPKDLQILVDKDEADREIRSDYENPWTTT